jgi:hypothetical protein
MHTRPLPRFKALCYVPQNRQHLHNEPVRNYFDHFTCICLDNPIFRGVGSLTLNVHFQNLSTDSSSSSSTWTTRTRLRPPPAPSGEYAFFVNNKGGASTLEMYAIADETLLQPSQVIILRGFRRISLKFSDQVWHEITLSRICLRVHVVSQSTGLLLTLLKLTHVAKSASSVEQVFFFD